VTPPRDGSELSAAQICLSRSKVGMPHHFLFGLEILRTRKRLIPSVRATCAGLAPLASSNTMRARSAVF
jgi:hypothetical protein